MNTATIESEVPRFLATRIDRSDDSWSTRLCMVDWDRLALPLFSTAEGAQLWAQETEQVICPDLDVLKVLLMDLDVECSRDVLIVQDLSSRLDRLQVGLTFRVADVLESICSVGANEPLMAPAQLKNVWPQLLPENLAQIE